MITAIQKQLATKPNFQKYMGSVLFISGIAAVSASMLVVQKTVFFFLGVVLILSGVYDLYMSRFYAIVKPGASITLGIGIQLVVLEIVEVWELLLLWPLSFILFGTITLLGGILEDWYNSTSEY